MTVQNARIANVILIALIISSGQLFCLWYVAAMHLSLEILNRQTIYLRHASKIYNIVFWSYELVLIERLFQHQASASFEWLLNCAEHLGFGIVICLKIYIYTAVLIKVKPLSRWERGIIALIIFNIIGVFNEVFQNFLCGRGLFFFVDDSIKDVLMNAAGGGVFLVAVIIRVWFWKSRKQRKDYSHA